MMVLCVFTPRSAMFSDASKECALPLYSGWLNLVEDDAEVFWKRICVVGIVV